MKNIQAFISEKLTSKRVAIMGVGSVLRSDDGAGMRFIEKLSSLINGNDVLLIAGSTAPENFTGVIKEFSPECLFIVDAAKMGGYVGEIKPIVTDMIDGMSFSTHMLPLSVMLKYLELEIGCEVVCIGIEPLNTEQGFEMCSKVSKSSENLAYMFYEALEYKKEVTK